MRRIDTSSRISGREPPGGLRRAVGGCGGSGIFGCRVEAGRLSARVQWDPKVFFRNRASMGHALHGYCVLCGVQVAVRRVVVHCDCSLVFQSSLRVSISMPCHACWLCDVLLGERASLPITAVCWRAGIADCVHVPCCWSSSLLARWSAKYFKLVRRIAWVDF